jgi:hypothetical protein
MIVSTSFRLLYTLARYRGWRRRCRVVCVEERKVLAREDVAGVHDAQRREYDPRVAVGVAAPE